MIYLVKYKRRKELETWKTQGIDGDLKPPTARRVKASDATRAISRLVNDLKASGDIYSKGDVKIIEVSVTE